MELILDHAKRILKSHITQTSTCVDFTMGNGNDTLFLAQHAPSGTVYAFDIQRCAVEHTEQLLKLHRICNVKLIQDSHSNLNQYLSIPYDAGVFNLGYLPGGDKSITTKSTSTLTALKQAVSLISDTGILVVVIYPGHPEGKIESEQVEKFFRSLDSSSFDVIKYQFINKKDPPYLIAVERRQKK